jgi:hypothetical protein
MNAITNDTRTVRDIYSQSLAGRSNADIASDLNTPRLRVGYIRSATGNRAALDRQRADISAYARAHGQDVDEWIEDACCSGNRDDRPGLDRLRALVAAGCVAEVLVYDMTRLGRDSRVLALYEELSAGTQVTCITPDPLSAPALMNEMNAVVTQYEALLRLRQGLSNS